MGFIYNESTQMRGRELTLPPQLYSMELLDYGYLAILHVRILTIF